MFRDPCMSHMHKNNKTKRTRATATKAGYCIQGPPVSSRLTGAASARPHLSPTLPFPRPHRSNHHHTPLPPVQSLSPGRPAPYMAPPDHFPRTAPQSLQGPPPPPLHPVPTCPPPLQTLPRTLAAARGSRKRIPREVLGIGKAGSKNRENRF